MATDKKSYGGKPWWVWLLIYVVIGGLVYYLVYYFVWGKKGGYNYQAPGNNQTKPYSY